MSFILRKAHKFASKGVLRTLQHVFKGKLGNAGVLLNERVLNLPPELAPALHNALLEDIVWAQHNEVCGHRVGCGLGSAYLPVRAATK